MNIKLRLDHEFLPIFVWEYGFHLEDYMGQTFGPIEGGIGLSIGRTYGSRLGEFIYACFAWYCADKYFSAQKFRFAYIIWY
jgi:hypothetical protein